MDLKVLDIFLMVLLAWGAYSGFKRGLLLEIFTIGAFFIAFIVSAKLLDIVVKLGLPLGPDFERVIPYLAFILIFVTTIFIVILIGKFCKTLLKMSLLGGFDSFAGGVIGICKWGLLMSTVIWLVKLLPLNFLQAYTTGTVLFPIIESSTPRLVTLFAHFFPSIKTWLAHINL